MIIDLHTHTSYGSACSYMDPSQLVNRAKIVGLDGVCITEHNQLWDIDAIERLRRKFDFLVIGGVEVTTDCGEVLVFGLHQPVLKVYPIEELRDMVDNAGGVMIAAHPFRATREMHVWQPPSNPSSLEAIAQRPIFQYVDAIEAYNGADGFAESDIAEQVCHHLDMKGTGGSDAHAVFAVGTCFTVFENCITGEQDLVSEIKAGRFRAANLRDYKLRGV